MSKIGRLLLEAYASGAMAIDSPSRLPAALLKSLVAAVDDHVVAAAIAGDSPANVCTDRASDGPRSEPSLLPLLERLLAEVNCGPGLVSTVLEAAGSALAGLDPEGRGPNLVANRISRLLTAATASPSLDEATSRCLSQILRDHARVLVQQAGDPVTPGLRRVARTLQLLLAHPAVPLPVVEQWADFPDLVRWAARATLSASVLVRDPPDLFYTMLYQLYLSTDAVTELVTATLIGLFSRKLPTELFARCLLFALVCLRGSSPLANVLEALAKSPCLTPDMLYAASVAASRDGYLRDVLLAHPALPPEAVQAAVMEAMSAPPGERGRLLWAKQVLSALAKNPAVRDEDLAVACLSTNQEVADCVRELLAARSRK